MKRFLLFVSLFFVRLLFRIVQVFQRPLVLVGCSCLCDLSLVLEDVFFIDSGVQWLFVVSFYFV